MRRVLIRRMLAGGALTLLICHAASAAGNPERNAYFGETHIHTSWSVDAWVMGNRPARAKHTSTLKARRSSIRWASASRSTHRSTSWG